MSRPLRVSHLISGDLWAGSETATFALLCALQRHSDVTVEVCVLNEGELSYGSGRRR